jgi:DNA-binding transcriptional MerR regulator
MFVHTVGMEQTEFSVHELAERSQVPVSSIRMYQQRKLLPPPERRGRNGVYKQSHLDRLVLIEQMQAKGYSLAAILDVLHHNSGGVENLLNTELPALAEQTVTMSLMELVQRLPTSDVSLETLQRTSDLGLIEINGTEVTVRQPAFLDAGSTLSSLKIPTSAILDAYESLRDNVAQIANEFASVFDTHTDIGRSLQAHEAISSDTLEEARAQLEQLTKTAVDVVASELRRALRVIATERLSQLAGHS